MLKSETSCPAVGMRTSSPVAWCSVELKDETAERLAELLEALCYAPPLSGTLSQLDQAALSWARVSAEVEREQRVFSEARFKHLDALKDGNASGSQEWTAAVEAAGRLAAALRSLGRRTVAEVLSPIDQ